MERCDECDWTFSCFNGSAPCSKKPTPPFTVEHLLMIANKDRFCIEARPGSNNYRGDCVRLLCGNDINAKAEDFVVNLAGYSLTLRKSLESALAGLVKWHDEWSMNDATKRYVMSLIENARAALKGDR